MPVPTRAINTTPMVRVDDTDALAHRPEVIGVPGEVVTPAAQASVDAYTEVSGSKIDTLTYGQTFVGYQLQETGTSKDITFKVQTSMDDSAWVDVTALDELGAAHGGVEIAVAASATDYAFITPSLASGAPSAMRYVRVVVKSTVGANPGEATVIGMSK